MNVQEKCQIDKCIVCRPNKDIQYQKQIEQLKMLIVDSSTHISLPHLLRNTLTQLEAMKNYRPLSANNLKIIFYTQYSCIEIFAHDYVARVFPVDQRALLVKKLRKESKKTIQALRNFTRRAHYTNNRDNDLAKLMHFIQDNVSPPTKDVKFVQRNNILNKVIKYIRLKRNLSTTTNQILDVERSFLEEGRKVALMMVNSVFSRERLLVAHQDSVNRYEFYCLRCLPQTIRINHPCSDAVGNEITKPFRWLNKKFAGPPSSHHCDFVSSIVRTALILCGNNLKMANSGQIWHDFMLHVS
ncbi:unnamed protein product [Caenorhabditis sp. 36 PRJEB53466]|nr:unnamed protein product [Caenorhabditis sp. 36 PRJEB53466]